MRATFRPKLSLAAPGTRRYRKVMRGTAASEAAAAKAAAAEAGAPSNSGRPAASAAPGTPRKAGACGGKVLWHSPICATLSLLPASSGALPPACAPTGSALPS
eukprot:362021-Chlamydomonas_euryale.AAC.4